MIISQTMLQCFRFFNVSSCLPGSHLFPLWYKNQFAGNYLSDVIHHSEHDAVIVIKVTLSLGGNAFVTAD